MFPRLLSAAAAPKPVIPRLVVRTLVLERPREKGSTISTDPIGDRSATVDPTEHAMKRIQTCYKRTLQILEKQFAPETAYRSETTKTIRNRLECFESSQSPEEFEQKLRSGSIEQILVQAENERQLAEYLSSTDACKPNTEQSPPPNQWNWPPLS